MAYQATAITRGISPRLFWLEDGRMGCRWIMPYKKSARLKVVCNAEEAVKVSLSINYQPWEWNDRSMYFHSNWGLNIGVNNLPVPNFNFISIKGKGMYVGDTLNVTSYSPKWWGEGPEKISIDGETFPSEIGTGSEDYYGYAFRDRTIFDAPFHAQPKIPEGPDFEGTSVNTRVHSLDAIPFNTSLLLNMEIFTHDSGAGDAKKLDYGVATYWYGFAETTGKWMS